MKTIVPLMTALMFLGCDTQKSQVTPSKRSVLKLDFTEEDWNEVDAPCREGAPPQRNGPIRTWLQQRRLEKETGKDSG